MKVWFDADNGPHVLIMRPLVQELSQRGHEVVFTARNRTNTPELLDLYGFSYLEVGGEYGKGKLGKIIGTLGRAWALRQAMKSHRPSVCFGHGSRALPIAAKMLGVPSVTMYDYEWVNATLFNWGCHSILMPSAISSVRCQEAGISKTKVVSYPGYKEELYLGGREIDETISADLGLRKSSISILLRPPATTAHYHNPEAEIILAAILKKIAAVDNVQLVFLPRTPDQDILPSVAGVKEVIIPKKVYDGPSLVACVDMVISGGGTMTREAAIMGVPSYSFFRGRNGMVDESLVAAGKLRMLVTAGEVESKLNVTKKEGRIFQPDPQKLVEFIAIEIIKAAN